jgi:orotate phosphoribosyltransferase
LGVRSIFVERKDGAMQLRRGFEIAKGERILICEDIITTGGSAMEASNIIESLGGKVVAFASLANRGFCKREGTDISSKEECKLPSNIPFFALADFSFQMFLPDECPMCQAGGEPIKPGSRNS